MNPKGIPNTERVWVKHIVRSKYIFYITSKATDTSMFFLYRFDEKTGTATKVGKDKSPLQLEELEKKFLPEIEDNYDE